MHTAHPDMPRTLLLLDATEPRTLGEWVERFTAPGWRGCFVEGWLFEGAEARRTAERRLAEAGVQARLRSAYKPLVHWFIEELPACCGSERPVSARVRYPVHPDAGAQRFRLEAYPLAALVPGCEMAFEAGGSDLHYEVTLAFAGGATQVHRVFAPNHVRPDVLGTPQLCATGWLRAGRSEGAGDLLDTAHATEFECLFWRAVQAVESHPWPRQEPYFERLDLRVDLPGYECPLNVPNECISTFEALHEDLYFGLLELFQRHSGRAQGSRLLQPGQLVPDVRPCAPGAPPRVRVEVRPFDTAAQDAAAWPDTDTGQALEDLDRSPAPARIAQELEQLGGEPFGAHSRQGRGVWGRYLHGSRVPVLVSGGQHANETSGVVGALRAGQVLAAQPGAHFALLPLKNPDGYALHRELGAHHPHHMHHAARYTALGDDLEWRESAPWYERQALEQGLALSGAQLHLNLHGYPAHEWTRPLTGYVPRGFDLWTIPKGFFLILRYHAGWETRATALLERVAAELGNVPGLVEFNAAQIALYERHAGALPFELIHGTACTRSEVQRGAPVTLITEFPDETIHGDAFRFAHTVQCATVLAAERAWQDIMAGG
ncbi:peptidase M14 [Paracidovorax avenae]|uniref:peptidase M14 n=1 Tax=Paracidovorax avenae TaxID=80867 RepID=UPI000D153B96|nr:peptidase M14 [Paracidovorax avenae]AVS98789.1 peptidase M14 [Paracidovorax avenae]AVT05865.1 peptidase M14 [Paracidovorax avenae]AVT20178.1 peptidase M14 [Paracidovorax avenae]